MEHPALSESTVYPPVSAQAVILTGPTASGKSRIAMELADKIDAEIVSLDSVAVYRGMDIGSAKPSLDDQQRVKHHLIDIISPTADFSVSQYLTHATACANEILVRGKRPLFVGGTPLYLKALLHGFDPGPPPDWDFRRAVEEDIRVHGLEALHKRLQQVDPLTARRLPPTDIRRITRALEVAFLTGLPLSHRQTQFEFSASHESAKAYAIAWPREILHQRIEARVNSMFEQDFVAEVAGLLSEHQTLSRTAASAVGYREVIDHLVEGTSLETTKQAVLFHTRRLARHQETWFRSLKSLHTLSVESDSAVELAINRICEDV